MSIFLPSTKPKNRWDYQTISVGARGPVGDTLKQVRFKHSFPDQAIRWDPLFSGNKLARMGANIQDGQLRSYESGGGPGRVRDSNWGGRRRFETTHGFIHQDLRRTDQLSEPSLLDLPYYTWKQKQAHVYQVKTGGVKFLPVPGPYDGPRGFISRGGQYPRVTDVAGGDDGPNVVTGRGDEQFVSADAGTNRQILPGETLSGRHQNRVGDRTVKGEKKLR
jgi:hypothetical protein